MDGLFRGAFTDVGGMDTTIEITEFPEGGHRHHKKLPGKVKYSNITLKYGLTDDRFLYDWLLDHAYIALAASAVTAEFLATFEKFPPRQRAASFTIDQAVAKLEAALNGAQ